jgi:hypothetical protein
VNHPANVYLREDRIVPPLDEWLGRLFEPERLDRTLDALAAAQCPPSREEMVQAEVRRQVVDADRKLARHRAALEAGADPAVVTAWIREVQAAKAEAEAQLRRLSQSPARTLDRDELVQITRALGDMVRVLADADPARKAKIYAGLGLRLTYHPDKRKVLVGQASAPVIGQQFVSEGGLELSGTPGHRHACAAIWPLSCLLTGVAGYLPGGIGIHRETSQAVSPEVSRIRPLALRHDERALAAGDPRVTGLHKDHDGPVRRAPADPVLLRQRQLRRHPHQDAASVNLRPQQGGQLLEERHRRVVVEIIRHTDHVR